MTGSPRITVRLPGDLHSRVHQAASDLGVDLAAYVKVVLDQATRGGVLPPAYLYAPQEPAQPSAILPGGIRYATGAPQRAPSESEWRRGPNTPATETAHQQPPQAEPEASDDFDESALAEPEDLPPGVRQISGSARVGEHIDETPKQVQTIASAPRPHLPSGKKWRQGGE